MPGGTMLFAGTVPPNEPSPTTRFQSTAAPIAWRTRTSSNGFFAVLKPRYVSESDGVSRSCGPSSLSYGIHGASITEISV